MTLFALGKAAAAMAAIACAERRIEHGLVVTRRGHVPVGLSLPPGVRLIEAGHPVPDQAGLSASREAMALANGLGPDDHLLALISGGGSALLPLPVPGVSLEQKQQLTRALLASGAPIAAINRVRQALSAIKGGRLAAAAKPARLTNIILSDVPGDDPGCVASGPTIAPQHGRDSPLKILALYGIAPSPGIATALSAPQPAAGSFPDDHTIIGARSATALAAAAEVAAKAGYRTILLDSADIGSVAMLADRHAGWADNYARGNGPVALISGGEADVAVAGDAPAGGRNTRFLVEFAARVRDGRDVHLLSADTDGVDGSSNVAGGILFPQSFASIAAEPEMAADAIRRDDALSLVRRIGSTFGSGPTCTNVNDLRIVLIAPTP